MLRGESGEWYREHEHDVFEHFLFHRFGLSVGRCQAAHTGQVGSLPTRWRISSEAVNKCVPGARHGHPGWTAATFAAQDLASRGEM